MSAWVSSLSLLIVVVLALASSQLVRPALALSAKQESNRYFENLRHEKDVTFLDSGIAYRVVKAGTGTVHLRKGQPLAMHYKASKLNGDEIDNSYKRGRPTRLMLNDAIIPAWQQILPKMVVGDRWLVYVPYDQAFGVEGRKGSSAVGPYQSLIFDMELVDIKKDWQPNETEREEEAVNTEDVKDEM